MSQRDLLPYYRDLVDLRIRRSKPRGEQACGRG